MAHGSVSKAMPGFIYYIDTATRRSAVQVDLNGKISYAGGYFKAFLGMDLEKFRMICIRNSWHLQPATIRRKVLADA